MPSCEFYYIKWIGHCFNSQVCLYTNNLWNQDKDFLNVPAMVLAFATSSLITSRTLLSDIWIASGKNRFTLFIKFSSGRERNAKSWHNIKFTICDKSLLCAHKYMNICMFELMETLSHILPLAILIGSASCGLVNLGLVVAVFEACLVSDTEGSGDAPQCPLSNPQTRASGLK